MNIPDLFAARGQMNRPVRPSMPGRAGAGGKSRPATRLELLLVDGQGFAFVRDPLQESPTGFPQQSFGTAGSAVDVREVEYPGLDFQREQKLQPNSLSSKCRIDKAGRGPWC